MENKSLKTFTVSAEDCQKIVKRFPDDEDDVEFFTNSNVKEGGSDSKSYSVYLGNKIRETFGLNVVVAMSYK